MGWMGSRTKTGWVRLRGNASGRNGVGVPKPWYCQGCQKKHVAKTERTQALDGYFYCNRRYFAMLEARAAHDRLALDAARRRG